MTKHISTIILFTFLCAVTLWPATGHATFVSPKRVMIENNQRVAVVTINNRKDETMVYTFDWEQRAQTPDGKKLMLKEGETAPGFRPASPYFQYSPRRVVIGPKKTQKVRILVKRPADMEEGEYHSHLLIKPVPLASKVPDIDINMQGGMGGIMTVRANLSIPVFLRHGETHLDIKITDAYITKRDGRDIIHASLANNSTRSAYLKPELLCFIPGQEEPTRMLIQTTKVYVEAQTVSNDMILPKKYSLDSCTSFKLDFSTLHDFEYKSNVYMSTDISRR